MSHADDDAGDGRQVPDADDQQPGQDVLDQAFPPLSTPRRPETTFYLPVITVDQGRRYDGLAQMSRAFADDYRKAAEASADLQARLKEQLHPAIWRLVLEAIESASEVADAAARLTEAELERHLPGLAPMLSLLWEHCYEMRHEDAGTCCVWMEPSTDPEV